MSEKKFDPTNPEYKKVEDLPKEHQDDFVNVSGGGFIGKSAEINLDRSRRLAEGEDFVFEIVNKFNEIKEEIKKCHLHSDIKIIHDKFWEIYNQYQNNVYKKTGIMSNEKIDSVFYKIRVFLYEKILKLCSTKSDFIEYCEKYGSITEVYYLNKWLNLCENKNDVEIMYDSLIHSAESKDIILSIKKFFIDKISIDKILNS